MTSNHSSTQTRVTQLLIAWLAVTVLILTAACTKKGGGEPAEETPAATPAPEQPPAPVPVPSELNGDSSQSAQDPATPQPTPESTPTYSPTVYYDPSGLSPEEIFSNSAAQGTPLSGALSNIQDSNGGELVYSGAGQDSLHEQLKVIIDSEADEEQRFANEEFARNVSLTTFDVNWHTRRVKLTVLVKRTDGAQYRVDFKGSLDQNLRFSAGSLHHYPNIHADLVCMDLSGGCATTHVRLRDGWGERVRTAHIITRETDASLYIQGNGFGKANNREYDRLLGYLLNTVHSPHVREKVNSLRLLTSETINGSSTLAITMRVGQNSGEQIMAWTGPLVKPASSDQLNIQIQPAPTRVTIDGQRVQMAGQLIDTIRETRLLRNDGRGNLQIELTVRKSSPRAEEDKLLLTVARIHKPTKAVVLH